jgi:hypothetical protein
VLIGLLLPYITFLLNSFILLPFYVMWFLVLIREKCVSSFYYNFVWRIVYTIYFGDLDNFSHTYVLYAWVLLACLLFLKFFALPEDESSVLSKCCVLYFICNDDGNSSKSWQWAFQRWCFTVRYLYDISLYNIFFVIEDSLLRSPASLSVLHCMLIPLCIL